MIRTENINEIFFLNDENFAKKAIEFYYHQKENSAFMHKFVDTLFGNAKEISKITDIPFLPIQFFKTEKIITEKVEFFDKDNKEIIFESSGTSQQVKSKHIVKDIALYKKSFLNCFERFFGKPEEYCFLALLPSYLERENSSLVYMMDKLMQHSKYEANGFYLYNHEELYEKILLLEKAKQKTLLVGVTYALLDFAEKYPIPLHYVKVMETGGMKGRREEMLREEVHEILKGKFSIPNIHSEYGMTELLSQAYSKQDGIFRCPPWMKVLVRDLHDPLSISEHGKGAINIIDLANIQSCCFIATDDAGEVFADGSFTITGRTDRSDMRGCSLLVFSA